MTKPFVMSASLKQAKVKKALRQQHRPCPTHGPVRQLCAKCLRVFCAKCKHVCTPKDDIVIVVEKKKPKRAPVPEYNPTKEMDPIWEVIQPLGALRIDPHPDSGHWAMMFPPRVLGLIQASELATRLWTDARLRLIAAPTPYGSGALSKPLTWYVTFSLKKG